MEICKLEMTNREAVRYLVWAKKEFRNLYVYRNQNRLVYRTLVKIIYPPVNTLYIEAAKIGGGLFSLVLQL